MVVAAAGMLVELAVAAVAAIIWTHTTAATTVHIICFNVMLVAGIATVLFNGNPLMRYDGYFILADLLEIPNLAQRGWEYVQYLVKRHAWGIEGVQSPAHAESEQSGCWAMRLAAAAYRAVICPWILLVVMDQLFIVGAVLATSALTVWLVLPCARFIRYLFTSPELAMPQAGALRVACGRGGRVAVLGFLPAPDKRFADGIVEAGRRRDTRRDGWVCRRVHSVWDGGRGGVGVAYHAQRGVDRKPRSLGCTTRLAHPTADCRTRPGRRRRSRRLRPGSNRWRDRRASSKTSKRSHCALHVGERGWRAILIGSQVAISAAAIPLER